MKRTVILLILVQLPIAVFAQLGQAGIQFSGVLSANVIDDFQSNTAYSDNNNGYTYLQLNGSFKDGPFGMESQLQFGPSPGTTSTVSNLYVHYGYGHATLLGGALYLAVGRVVDLNTFGLSSWYQQSPNGPGVYGAAVGKVGSSGFGVDGVQLKIVPGANVVLGVVMPYNINPSPIVDSTIKGIKVTGSYTIPKTVQFVLGYQQHVIGVADYVVPASPTVDPNTVVNKNKLYGLANLLISENLTAGIRYELDHDIAAAEIISHNIYATVGGKIGNFSLGADSGLYIPPSGSAGLELLGAAWYTFPSVLPSVDVQPYVQAGYFTSGYPLVSDLIGVSYTNGFDIDNYLYFNPELKLLLGKSQHELVFGYS